jgi:hypothetical protein
MSIFLSKPLDPWGKLCGAVTVNHRRAHRTLALDRYQDRLFGGAFAAFVGMFLRGRTTVTSCFLSKNIP